MSSWRAGAEEFEAVSISSQFRQEYDPDRYICDRIILCINQPSTYSIKIEIMVLVDRTVLADQGAIFIFRIGSCIMM